MAAVRPDRKTQADRRQLAALALVVALVPAGCRGDASGEAIAEPPPEEGEQGSPSAAATLEQQDAARAGCPPAADDTAPDGPSAEATVLAEGDDEELRVEGILYPRPDYEGDPWSQWGQGLVLDDGRFWSAIGDHRGPDGNSFFFTYDPANATLTRFGDVLGTVDHEAGSWGYGKIHGQLVAGSCGEVWAATYWGTRRGLEFGGGYAGDVLLRLDPASHAIEAVEVPVPRHGVPSLAGWSEGGLVYGEAVDPTQPEENETGSFFAYDTAAGEVLAHDTAAGHTGFRNLLIDASGAAYIALDDGRLAAYRPGGEGLQAAGGRLPGGWLRASTAPTLDGTVYGATQEPDRLFARDADGTVRDLGPARGYVASVALHPDGERFLYVPGAHGDSWEQGAPLVAVDGQTGEEEVLVELNDLVEDGLGLRLAGTYSVAVDHRERLVYIGMNAGDTDADNPFGEVVLLVVHLP